MSVDGENYLVPISANPQKESDLSFQMIATTAVLREMQDSGARLNIMILDACRNNPFAGRGLRATGGGLAEMLDVPEGTLISYATKPGAVASDGDGKDSPYTLALAQVLPEPGVDILRTFNDVGLAVAKDTGKTQEPWMSNSPIGGDFYFVPNAAATPGQASPPKDSDTVFWQSIEQSNDPADFQDYIKRYPNGEFIDLARNRLAELQKPTPVATSRGSQEAESQEGEIVYWQSIQNSKDRSDFEAYLKRYPNGQFSELARSRVKEIKRETAVAKPHPVQTPSFNQALSGDLSRYLHHNRLPYVDAVVLSNRTGEPSSMVLSGSVRTETGKRDAELKSRDFLGGTQCRITNRIKVNAALASAPPPETPPREISSTPGDAPNTASCYDSCNRIHSNCLGACDTQIAGATLQQAPGVMDSLKESVNNLTGSVTSNLGNHEVCTNSCETNQNSCMQLCDLKSKQ